MNTLRSAVHAFAPVDQSPRARWRRYAAALLLCAASIVGTSLFRHELTSTVFLLSSGAFGAAVFLIEGPGPSLLVIAAGYGAAAYYLLAPIGSFAIDSRVDQLRLATSIGFCLLGILFQARFLRERHQLRRRDRELTDSERRYRVLLEQSSDAILVLDDQLDVTLANSRACELLGQSAEKLVGAAAATVFATEYDGDIGTLFASVEASRSHRSERRVRRPDGAWFIGELSIRTWGDGLRQVVLRDVTAQRLETTKLRAERDLLDGILATNGAAIVAVEAATGRILFVNDRAEVLTGLSREELSMRKVGKGLWTVTDLEGHAMPRERLPTQRVLDSGEPVHGVEVQVVLGDRRLPLSISAAPLRDDAGTITAIVLSMDDLTERVRAQSALRASEEKLEHVTELVPGAVFQLERDRTGGMRFTYVSAGIEILTGLTPAEVVLDFARVWNGILPEHHDRLLQSLTASATTGQPWAQDFAVRDEAGQVRWLRGTSNPEQRHHENTTRWNGFFLDITAHKQLEQDFQQAQKIESIGRLAGGIAHDFNNILTAIRGNVDLLLDDLEAHDPRTAEVRDIRDAADRAGTLTRQLLAFSRRQVMELRDLDLNVLVRDVEKMLRRVIGEDIVLLTQPGDSLGTVRADPGQLEQVLLNLAVNARDAMSEGGLLTIETRNVRVDASLAAQLGIATGDYVTIIVRDTGAGMSPEVKSRIFEPFFTTKTAGKGAGLGLAMVYGIVRQSGGAIIAESEPYRGSTFRIYMPCIVPTNERAFPMLVPRASDQPLRGRARILLVEDEPAVRQLTKRILERQGYDVVAAHDAYEALTLAGDTCDDVDLLVTDVIMPGMSGRDLALEFRHRRASLRILFVSGYLDIDVGRLSLNKTTRLLLKPFTQELLTGTVRGLLGIAVPDAGAAHSLTV